MCEANVYYAGEDGKEEMIMEEVDLIIPQEDGSYMIKGICGNQKFIEGEIQEISLLNHKIVFKGNP